LTAFKILVIILLNKLKLYFRKEGFSGEKVTGDIAGVGYRLCLLRRRAFGSKAILWFNTATSGGGKRVYDRETA